MTSVKNDQVTNTYFSREDYKPNFTENYEEVCVHLKGISQKLYDLLPDISLSPDERLERLARVIPKSILISENHKTARTKLNKLRNRLDELVPDENLDYYQKIDYLVGIANNMVPEDIKLYKKLEKIDDYRLSDIGRN
ncbi:hypothetical protein ORN01_21990 [Bacillus cereus]|uniref:hypothetical protein n=1 Tax=Bacillus TaxID=1386 RepID=UPI000279CDF6|nr:MULTISPECIES: hypothetical protein [Bacillus]EJR73599.1 hypothetical protein IK9_05134 [Bacillus cereus VD166]MDA1913608.1 hypothetical protein [Bacillus cereus]MDA2659728.1 hypothetical protein [Bacillus cereus]MDZ4631644.1 hypothetical protein [Bacillus cereus]